MRYYVLVDGFDISPFPGLRSPVVVVAFSGWSDTGTVTTDTAQRLIDAFGGRRFLSVDPEPYYVFTDTRPTVHLDSSGVREIQWPVNEAYAAHIPDAAHDLIIVKGVEPNLKWRTFSSRMGEAIATFEPSLVCTLVARPAATPHTRPIPVTGSSADPALVARYGLGRSMYQGPTGIIGVLHDVLRRAGAPLVSLVAAVPHYLNVEENPPASIALLKALEPMLGYRPPLGTLEEEAQRFIERVDEASRDGDEIRSYVRTLEEHYGEQGSDADSDEAEGLPSADQILRDVEDLLRGNTD
jgi:proteasome assembly chaperone (PAC2) family protein